MRAALLVVSLLLAGPSAFAQAPDTAAFQVERFEPGTFIGTDILNISTTSVTPHLVPSVGLLFHYVDNPLVVRTISSRDGIEDRIDNHLIDAQLKVEVLAAIALWDRIALGLAMPVALWSQGDDLAIAGRPGDTVSGVTAGDLRLVPKFVILAPGRDGGFGIDVHVPIYFPTGDPDRFMGDDVVRLRPSLGVDWRSSGGFVVALNLGYMIRPERASHDYVSDDDFSYGLGVQVPMVSGLEAIGSVFGSVQTVSERNPFALEDGEIEADEDDDRGSPIEIDAGLRWRFDPGWSASLAAGTGLTDDVGSPRFRAILGVGYTPTSRDRDGDGIDDADDVCPDVPEDHDGFDDVDGCPDPDNDQDGILDVNDKCPNEAEDKDDFEDADGCPDLDNDQDGILDVNDQCPNAPEDKDGFEDGDGCPDPDNDRDGVLDVNDKCPDIAEDKDGFEDGDGCPDPDNDGDGIFDVSDKCPNQPETKNGVDDEDGCPDSSSKFIRITPEQVVILKKVFFAYDRDVIKPESYAILNDVAQTLRENPWITKLRVDGHTDSDGPDAYNLDLSTRRAASVMRYLVQSGIDPARLDSRGFGETVPLIDNKTALHRAENRRVEFRILEVYGKPMGAVPATIEQIENKPTTTE